MNYGNRHSGKNPWFVFLLLTKSKKSKWAFEYDEVSRRSGFKAKHISPHVSPPIVARVVKRLKGVVPKIHPLRRCSRFVVRNAG